MKWHKEYHSHTFVVGLSGSGKRIFLQTYDAKTFEETTLPETNIAPENLPSH